jgi:adenylate kinase
MGLGLQGHCYRHGIERMITFVCGLSKSGKSTLINQADVAKIPADHVRASELLRKLHRPTVDLRAANVLSNQDILVDWLDNSLRSNPRLIVLDGHLLLETLDGPQLVPDQALTRLPITHVICIRGEPKEVADRRRGLPLTQSVDEIRDLMAIEEILARRFARLIRARLSTIGSADVASFHKALHGL